MKTMQEAVQAAHEAFIQQLATITGLTVDQVREALPPPPPGAQGGRAVRVVRVVRAVRAGTATALRLLRLRAVRPSDRRIGVGADGTVRHNDRTVDETDRSDILAARSGDEAAFARLVGRHQPAVAGLLWRFTREPARLEELVQDVFVEAYFRPGRIPRRGAARALVGPDRDTRRVSVLEEAGAAGPGVARRARSCRSFAPADDPDPAAAGALVHALLSRLPPAERLVLTLMYFDGCSVADIAGRMGWSRAMVKMRAYRARRRLKEIAGKEHLLEKTGWTS